MLQNEHLLPDRNFQIPTKISQKLSGKMISREQMEPSDKNGKECVSKSQRETFRPKKNLAVINHVGMHRVCTGVLLLKWP